jgi:UbiD family decarboxylase
MVFESLRDFVTELDRCGQLHRIPARVEKDWEVGAICRENFDREGPALLFQRVENHRTPLLVGTLATRERYALALGIPPTVEAVSEKWRKAYAHPIKPEVVAKAPCKEVVLSEVDLYADPFPIPKWHALDAGPELGTLHGVITQDPETGWINVGDYRNEIFTKDTVGCYVLIIPYRHIRMHWDKWRQLGKPMPVAIAIGPDPYLSLTSVAAVPTGVDEYDIAGGLKGAPIHVVKAELSDLLVPAHAEIILEGEMPTDSFWPEEGPFGEFTGYMGEKVKDSHYIRIQKITHRKEPIFHATYEGRPPSESTTVRSLARSAAVYEHLRRAGLVGIRDVCVTPGGCAGFHAVVSIKKSYPGHVRDVVGHVWGHPTLFCKHVTVVDEDIDPWNSFRVEWATSTRVQAGRDVMILRGGKSISLDPSQPPSRRGEADLLGIDATRPVEEYKREGAEFPATTDPPGEWIEKARQRWKEYGFPD